ncbi:N-acetyltransferase eso1 [Cystobasidiomycetes sp. EMM_F5]
MITRHKQTNFPMTANLTVDYISGFGERLLKEFMSERNDKWRISIMSLSFSGLERVEKGQKGIQRFFGANGNNIAGIDRGSPAPSDSEKLLGKRKQSEEVVDLTLGDPTSEAEPIDNLTIPVNNANGEAGQTLLTDDEDEDDDLLEVQPTGPVFKCPRCNGYVSITPLPGEQMSTATVRVEKAHIAKHIQADSVQAAARSTMTKKPSTKKRKGQQKLKSFFTKA